MTRTLRTDVENIHTDGRSVLVGTLKGEILISRFVPPTKHHPGGRWHMLASTDWPVAWDDLPSHPYFPTPEDPA